MGRIQAVFWDYQEVITRQNGYHNLNYKATQGNTQVRLISPTLSNLIMDNMVRNWLALKVG